MRGGVLEHGSIQYLDECGVEFSQNEHGIILTALVLHTWRELSADNFMIEKSQKRIEGLMNKNEMN